jgi:hypothetical protein
MPQDYFGLFFAMSALWVGLVGLASVAYRRAKGKPLFRPRFEQPRFLESWRSGRSLRSVLTRVGGANNCLWIAVTDKSLFVAPHFPFTLLFLPEIYRLEHAVEGRAIRSVARREGMLNRNRVRVSYAAAGGDEEAFEVSLKDPDGFVRAVEAIRQGAPHPGGG